MKMKGLRRFQSEHSECEYFSSSVVDPHWFQCGSGSCIVSQCGSGSRVWILMTNNFKVTAEKKFKFSFKNFNLFIPRYPWRTFKLQETPSALRKDNPALQTKKMLYFLLLFVIFALLDPEPADQNPSADPDPQHWIFQSGGRVCGGVSRRELHRTDHALWGAPWLGGNEAGMLSIQIYSIIFPEWRTCAQWGFQKGTTQDRSPPMGSAMAGGKWGRNA